MMKELVEARTPALRLQPQSPKLGGCVGVFFNFFDWNKRLHGSRLFSKRLPAERPDRSVKPVLDEKRTAAKLLLIADESRVSSPSKDGTAGKEVVVNGGVLSPPKRVPGVVARLMGLESLPSNNAPRTVDGKVAQSRRDDVQDGRSSRAAQGSKLLRQEAVFVVEQPRGDKGPGDVRMSPGRANLSGPVRRSAGGDTVLPSAMGKKGSAMNEGVRKSPKKRSPPSGHFNGDYTDRRRSADGEVGSKSRSGGQIAKLGSDDPRQVMSKMAGASRRPILVPSKSHNKVASPNRSPTRMGSKSAAILLEAAQKILEPNTVKGRSAAGRPSPVKGPPQEHNVGHSVSVSGGRRALDFRGAFPTSDSDLGDETEASCTGDSQSFEERPRMSATSSKECWDSSFMDQGEGAIPYGGKKPIGSSSPGPQWLTVVTLHPASVAKSPIHHPSYPPESEEEAVTCQEPLSRGRHLNPSPPASKFGGSPGNSFRLQDRASDFETVMSRYQESPNHEPGKKKEAFGKHDQLGKLTPEQKSELVRSLSVTDQPETLHRSGSVKERVSRASSKMGSLLRSKSAREDKKLLGHAHFLEGQPAEHDQVKANSEAKVKVKRSPRFSGASKSVVESSGSPSHPAAVATAELVSEKKGIAGFRAMKVLRGKSGRKQEMDLSPPSSRVFPTAGPSEAEDSPGSTQGSEPESCGSRSSGGLLSYSRIFRVKKDKDADENSAEEDVHPKKNDTYSMRSLLRRKPSSPEGPIVLRRGSRKIQADKPSTGQVMSMSPDVDEGFGRGSRGSSFDSSSGKLPLGCLVSELADVLEELKDDTSKAGHVSPRKPFSVTNMLSSTGSGLAHRKSERRIGAAQDCKTSRQRDGDEGTVGINNEMSDNDLFDDKTVDEDYERRKAQARLTRALQRGSVTQFRGDGHWCERPDMEEDPEMMFAAYIDSRINDSIEHDTFWRKVLDQSDDGYENRSSSPINDYLLKRVKELHIREYDLESGSKKDSEGNNAMSPPKPNQMLDSLQHTSSVKCDMGTPLVRRVLIAEADSRDRPCDDACINDSGQPSPVSTLEAPFEDESSQDGISQEGSSPKAVVQLDMASDGNLQGDKASLYCTVELPEMGLTSTEEQDLRTLEARTASSCDGTRGAVDTSSIMEAIMDLSRIRHIDLMEIGLLQEPAEVSLVEDEDQAYITEILRRADFLEEAPKWHSGRLPVDPDLFSKLENQERGWSETELSRNNSDTTSPSRNDGKSDPVPWLDRKLFFDCVNEALYVKLRKYVEDEPWSTKEVVCMRPQPTGKQLVQQVHEQVSEWRNMDVEPVDSLVLYDMRHGDGGWTNFVQEVSEIGLEIERHILRTMIEELVTDTLGYLPLPKTLCA